MSLPKADLESTCASSQFTQAIPCLYQPAPWSGQSIQFRIDRTDFSGLTTRKFGYVHGHPGTTYEYSNCRPTADAQFMFCPGYWLDGVRTEWLAYRIPSAFPVDSVNRTTFVPVNVTYQGCHLRVTSGPGLDIWKMAAISCGAPPMRRTVPRRSPAPRRAIPIVSRMKA